MTSKSTTPHLIVIAPNHTKIDDKIITPCTISIVLENGHSFDIDEIVHLLDKHDRKKHKIKRPGRIRRFFRAFKEAARESADEDRPMAVKVE